MKRRPPPDISIILPYLSGSSCIEKCLRLVKENTRSSFEVCSVVDTLGAYEAYNAAASTATGEVLLYLNDDMFVAPGWDAPFLEAAEEKCIVTGYLVESGRVPVNHRNIERNFGQEAEAFDSRAFFSFVESYAKAMPGCEPGVGWYMPFAVRRTDAIPFPTKPGFPNDSSLFGMFAARGYKFRRVKSFAYHLQRMSEW